jgi:hypothetical protein
MFEHFDGLSEIAVDVLYSSLTLSVVNSNDYFNCLTGKVQHFVNTSLDLDVVVGTETAEATAWLKVALELDLLCGQALDALTFDIFKLLHLINCIIFFLFFLNIADSLTLQHLSFILEIFVYLKICILILIRIDSSCFQLSLIDWSCTSSLRKEQVFTEAFWLIFIVIQVF